MMSRTGMSRPTEGIFTRCHSSWAGPGQQECELGTSAPVFRTACGDHSGGASPAYIAVAIEESLRRLATGTIDLGQIHGLDPPVPVTGTLGALAGLVTVALAALARAPGSSLMTCPYYLASPTRFADSRADIAEPAIKRSRAATDKTIGEGTSPMAEGQGLTQAGETPSTNVVVVGAGPTGLLTALLLANLGLSVAVIERFKAPYPLPRAVALSGESLRVLQLAGLAGSIPELITPIPPDCGVIHFVGGQGELLMKRPLPPADHGWPSMAGFGQPDLEAILERELAGHPQVEMHRGLRVVDLEQKPDRVIVTAVAQDGADAEDAAGNEDAAGKQRGSLTLAASLVVGADGARSMVRERIGSPVTDLGFAFDWLVIDIAPLSERRWDPYLAQYLDPKRPATSVGGGRGSRRFEFMCLPGETAEEMNQADVAWRLLEPWKVDPSNSRLIRHAVYQFRGQWAERWHDGRLVLAGDAAHLMPPFLGQGLNSGIRDAAALAWRANLLLSGRVPLSTLADYGSERLGHVRQIVEEAVRTGQLICETDPERAAARDAMLRAAYGNPHAVPPAPVPWRLGAGTFAQDDPVAGRLSIQGRVEVGGRRGLFDDVVGGGRFLLLSRTADPSGELSGPAAAAWDCLGGFSARVVPGGADPEPTQGQKVVADLDGHYTAWMASLGVDLVLIRPDFYVFATGATVAEADRLVLDLAAGLGLRAETAAADH